MRRSRELCATWALTLAAALTMAANVRGQGTTEILPVPQVSAERLAIAESVIAREEAASERPFDPPFRAKTLERLAALPVAALLQAQTQDAGGLGLNVLGDSQADLVYTPVTPCRIIDTRVAGGRLSVGVPRFLKVTGDTTPQGGANCGIPFGPATSAVVNFVAVSPSGKGNMQITPFGQPMPTASFINYSDTAGTNLANGLAVALCNPSAATCTDDITIQANNSAVDLVADVQGYFQRVSTGGVTTALLADGAVTSAKVAPGAVVKSLNGQTDAVTLAGANGLGVTQGSGTVTVTSNATDANTPGAIVSRDGLGNFSAGSVILAGDVALPNTAGPYVGVIALGGERFLHNFGTRNAFAGSQAGNTSMTGVNNSAFGYRALYVNTSGSANTAVGGYALYSNTTGVDNSAFGSGALESNTTSSANSAFGSGALYSNTTSSGNSAFGSGALQSNATSGGNSAFGAWALNWNTDGYYSAAFGYQALFASTSGAGNAAFGAGALDSNTTGHYNVAVGYLAGGDHVSGDNNVYISHSGLATEYGAIRIGTTGTHTATYIAGIYSATSASGVPVYVNSSGQLGTTTSSRRYKEQIADMDTESDVLMRLRPVSFYYRPELDGTHLRQYGLVAEEVAEVAPRLVAYDSDGTPETVRYHFVNAMLLTEVQKQRRQLEAQEAEIRELRSQRVRIQDLEARLSRLEGGSGSR